MRSSRTACGRNLGLAVAACLLPATVRADRLPVAPPLLGGEAASALWSFLPWGYLLTVAIEVPVLLVGLSAHHPLRDRLLAGLALTAFT